METHSLAERRGSPDRFNSVGIEGPKISASRMPVLWPARANDRARLTAMVLLPTPPFADETATIFFTSFMLRF